MKDWKDFFYTEMPNNTVRLLKDFYKCINQIVMLYLIVSLAVNEVGVNSTILSNLRIIILLIIVFPVVVAVVKVVVKFVERVLYKTLYKRRETVLRSKNEIYYKTFHSILFAGFILSIFNNISSDHFCTFANFAFSIYKTISFAFVIWIFEIVLAYVQSKWYIKKEK